MRSTPVTFWPSSKTSDLIQRHYVVISHMHNKYHRAVRCVTDISLAGGYACVCTCTRSKMHTLYSAIALHHRLSDAAKRRRFYLSQGGGNHGNPRPIVDALWNITRPRQEDDSHARLPKRLCIIFTRQPRSFTSEGRWGTEPERKRPPPYTANLLKNDIYSWIYIDRQMVSKKKSAKVQRAQENELRNYQ